MALWSARTIATLSSHRVWHVALFSSSKVPTNPTWIEFEQKELPTETKIDKSTIELLERLALVDFNNEAGIDRLSKAVRFADRIQLVNTEGVQPMDSVLEDRSLYMRNDKVTEGNCREDIMRNAAKREEEYFVAPPGNIPLKVEKKSYLSDASTKTES